MKISRSLLEPDTMIFQHFFRIWNMAKALKAAISWIYRRDSLVDDCDAYAIIGISNLLF